MVAFSLCSLSKDRHAFNRDDAMTTQHSDDIPRTALFYLLARPYICTQYYTLGDNAYVRLGLSRENWSGRKLVRPGACSLPEKMRANSMLAMVALMVHYIKTKGLIFSVMQ